MPPNPRFENQRQTKVMIPLGSNSSESVYFINAVNSSMRKGDSQEQNDVKTAVSPKSHPSIGLPTKFRNLGLTE